MVTGTTLPQLTVMATRRSQQHVVEVVADEEVADEGVVAVEQAS